MSKFSGFGQTKFVKMQNCVYVCRNTCTSVALQTCVHAQLHKCRKALQRTCTNAQKHKDINEQKNNCSMDQLEMFREQLRRKPGDPRPTTQESPASAETEKVKKKRKPAEDSRNIRIWSKTGRNIRLLSVWLEANEGRKNLTLTEIVDEAVEYLIENKYPKAKALIKHVK